MASDRAVLFRDPFFDADSLSALLPFAIGAGSVLPGRKHRDMPLDVKEVYTNTLAP
jgi:hypothetical protein